MAFKLKSGNTTSFKLMGGAEKSPAKDMKTGKYSHSFESPSKAKKLFGEATTPAKDYDVSKGSHNHPHDAPSKMYGKMKSPAKDTNPHTGFNPPHTEKNHGEGLKKATGEKATGQSSKITEKKRKLTDREKRIEKAKEFNAYAEKEGLKPPQPTTDEEVEAYTAFYADKSNVNMLNKKQKEYFASKKSSK